MIMDLKVRTNNFNNFQSSLYYLSFLYLLPEVTLFCTLDHIQRSCDLTLYCILSKLADWRHKHNAQFPEIIFIQCDGGSENANRYLLALLEFIVVK